MFTPSPTSQRRPFRDRAEAGRELARHCRAYRKRTDVVVLGLPRGGVPVAYEVSRTLGTPLDVFMVRKLGLPGHDELAMGAVASGGVLVINDDVVRRHGVGPEVVERVAEREQRELARRESAYRGDRPPPELAGRTVLLIDDGLATGASMRAAVAAVGHRAPARVVVAVPVAPASACADLVTLADEVVCAWSPAPFLAVGAAYVDFTQVTDEEVVALLREAPSPPA